MRKTKKISVMVRERDLAFLVLEAPESESGQSLWSPLQKEQINEFSRNGEFEWEWFHWVVVGKSQTGGSLKGKLAQLHRDLMERVEIVKT